MTRLIFGAETSQKLYSKLFAVYKQWVESFYSEQYM